MSTQTQAHGPSFEEALQQLETLVRRMEDGDTPLAELIARYEEGTRLLQLCASRLQEAELKLEVLKNDKGGANFAAFETTRD